MHAGGGTHPGRWFGQDTLKITDANNSCHLLGWKQHLSGGNNASVHTESVYSCGGTW